MSMPDRASPVEAVAALEPENLQDALDREGFAITAPIVDADTCAEIAGLYSAVEGTFRSTVTMARHGFGSGEYKYFARPCPAWCKRCGVLCTRGWRRLPTHGRRA